LARVEEFDDYIHVHVDEPKPIVIRVNNDCIPTYSYKELLGFTIVGLASGIMVGLFIGVDLAKYWGW